MANGKRILIIFLFLISLPGLGQTEMSYRHFDSLTFLQYSSGDWKELIKTGNEALRIGYDTYYLRLRLGVACFERKNFLLAMKHFEEALKFNSGDPFAGEYLYASHLEMNRPMDAYRVFDQLPSRVRNQLDGTLPSLHQAGVSAGHLFSDQPEKFDHFDLDGSENYYGETDMTLSGNHLTAGLSWGFKQGIYLYGGYTWIALEKNKLVQINDSLTVDDQYPLDQHQVYLSGHFPVGWGISAQAAVNYLIDNYKVTMPRYDPANGSYSYPRQEYNLQSVIAFISLTRDFKIVRTAISGAWSNLNDRRQVQAGFHALAFPLGNLNFYFSSKLLDHMVDDDHHFIYEQMVGFRIAKPLWMEANFTVGEMKDYYDQSAFRVYNFTDAMQLKGGGRMIWIVNRRISLEAEYIFLRRKGNYVVWQDARDPVDPAVPVTINEYFSNHLAIFSLNIKF